MALSGQCRGMMFKPSNAGMEVMNKAGIMAKYFATSWAIEKMVNNTTDVKKNRYPVSYKTKR